MPEMRKRIIVSSGVSLLYLFLKLSVGGYCCFYQIHNDYWDLLFIAKNIDFSNLHSLFNPCIPFGYTSLLHFLIKTGSEVTVPIIVNIMFTSVTVFVSAMFFTTMMKKKTGLIAALLIGLFPPFFFYSNQGGADPGAAMFFSAGALLLIRQSFGESARRVEYLLSGLLMGAGALFRFHVLAGAVFLVAVFLLFNPEKWKYAAIAIIGVSVSYVPQMVVSAATGHGIFATKLGATNIYDLMYGINWYATSTETIPANAVTVISSDVALFIKKYCYCFAKFFLVTGIIPLTAGIIVRDPLAKKMSRMITVFVVLYFGLFSATLSGRQVLLPLPLTMLCLGLLIDDVGAPPGRNRRFGEVIHAGILTGTAGMVLLFMYKDIGHVSRIRHEASLANKIAVCLKQIGCTATRQIYTTDFNLSFRDIPGHIGLFSGGWMRWGAYRYNELVPELNTSSVDGFIKDCVKMRVWYLLLTDGAKQVSPAMDDLYLRRIQPDEISFVKEIDRVRIYQLRSDLTESKGY